MFKKFVLTFLVLIVTNGLVFAETWIPNYGYYENKNEILAKDRIMDDFNNIFDFEKSPNVGGERIEQGRYYIETKYQGGYNGTDADYVYLDEVVGKDGTNGVDGRDGQNGLDGRDGVDGQDGEKGEKGDKGKQGERGLQGRGLENRHELIVEGRLFDTKRTTFSVYSGYDTNNRVSIVGAKLTIKFGTSYEERELNKLKREIETLKNR